MHPVTVSKLLLYIFDFPSVMFSFAPCDMDLVISPISFSNISYRNSPAQKMWICTVQEAKTSDYKSLQSITDKGEGRREGISLVIHTV